MNESINVLFVGNSYYYNGMPEIYFLKEAERVGCDMKVTAVTKGGAYFSEFIDPASEVGKLLRENRSHPSPLGSSIVARIIFETLMECF